MSWIMPELLEAISDAPIGLVEIRVCVTQPEPPSTIPTLSQFGQESPTTVSKASSFDLAISDPDDKDSFLHPEIKLSHGRPDVLILLQDAIQSSIGSVSVNGKSVGPSLVCV